MTDFTKIFGIPGAGKTTRLLTELGEIISSGGSIDSVCFVTFSKSAGLEIKRGVSEKFGVEFNQLLFYGTIHSICNRLLGWDLKGGNQHLASDNDKADYLSQYGLTYPINNSAFGGLPETSISEEYISQISDEEKIFAVINLCNNRLIPLKNWKQTEVFFDDIDPSYIYEICKGWKEYKWEKGLVDFDDMLIESVSQSLTLPVETLFVDEFQDLTPLLYKVFSCWSKDMENVIVAGDDDQTIYTWAGASPSFLLKLDAEEEMLSNSHRVPSDILVKAEALISTVENRQSKEFHACNPGGEFIHLTSPSFDSLLKYLPVDPAKSVYFLFRTNYLANIFCESYLVPYGIPFTKLKPRLRMPDVWTKRLVDIRNALVNIQQEKMLTCSEVKRLIKILPSCSKGNYDGYVRYGRKTWFKKENKKNEWTVRDILNDLLVKLPIWNDRIVLRKIGSDLQQKAYTANMQQSYYQASPFKIKVGTLHSAKGLEADVVYVFNNHSKAIEEHLLENGQSAINAEKRLFYVGITRARETCVLIDGFFDKFVFDMEVWL